MKALQVKENGAPVEVMHVVDIPAPEPGDGQVLIRVSAGSLNFNDIDRCYGRAISVPTPPPFILGMDVCGVVEQAGEGAQQWVGKRVVAVTNNATGGLAEYAVAAQDMVFEAPENMSDAEATAFLIPFHTAYLAVMQRARLEGGETLLVHAGASSVGAAAIQLGVAAGAKVIATVSSEDKAQYCKVLGAELVIVHTADSFDEKVLDHTDNVGAHVILDLAGGDFVEPSWRCVALEGRYVAAGYAQDEENGFGGRALRPTCFGNFSILGVMMAYSDNNPPAFRRMGVNLFTREVGERVHTALLGLAEQGQIKPNLERTVSLADAAQALSDQEHRLTKGRTVVEVTAA
jgi:NADPH2:quinone reductase